MGFVIMLKNYYIWMYPIKKMLVSMKMCVAVDFGAPQATFSGTVYIFRLLFILKFTR